MSTNTRTDRTGKNSKQLQSPLLNNKRSMTRKKNNTEMKSPSKTTSGTKKPGEQVSIEYGSLKITGSLKDCMPILEREQNKRWNYKYLMAAVAILLLAAAIIYKQQWIIPTLPGLFIGGKSISLVTGAIKKYNERRNGDI